MYAKYGNVVMKRQKCPRCKDIVLIIDGKTSCCELPLNEKQDSFKVMTGGQKRKCCPRPIQKKLLKEQDNKCYYCDLPFNTPYMRKHKLHFTKVAYDHFVPYAYSQSNDKNNWVASCRLCNSIKHSKVFETKQDAKDFIVYQRGRKQICLLED